MPRSVQDPYIHKIVSTIQVVVTLEKHTMLSTRAIPRRFHDRIAAELWIHQEVRNDQIPQNLIQAENGYKLRTALPYKRTCPNGTIRDSNMARIPKGPSRIDEKPDTNSNKGHAVCLDVILDSQRIH